MNAQNDRSRSQSNGASHGGPNGRGNGRNAAAADDQSGNNGNPVKVRTEGQNEAETKAAPKAGDAAPSDGASAEAVES